MITGDGGPEDEFNVYVKGSEGPVLLLLHGGGHSALSWALFACEIATRCKCRVVAPDLRGHGSTKTSDETGMMLRNVLSKKCLIMWQICRSNGCAQMSLASSLPCLVMNLPRCVSLVTGTALTLSETPII